MKSLSCIILLVFFLELEPACGNMYFWVDDRGIKHFSNITRPENLPVRELAEISQAFENLTSGTRQAGQFKVVRVFDGDSLQVTALDLIFSIRLVGIDAPETGSRDWKGQPLSREAGAYLEHLLQDGPITLKGYGTDVYHRQLAEIFIHGRNINLEMIREGYAEIYQGTLPKDLDADRYLEAQARAKKDAKGIWKLGKAYESPRKWRREHPKK